MKTKHLGLLLLGAAAIATAGFMHASQDSGLVVHEWGTFTSLQGSDGVALKWNPLESSRLPGFVYNWQHPGLGRSATGMLALGSKNALVTLQRMETPVVYFYTDKEQTVDLGVRFPQGAITEWYPQAPEVGPSSFPPNKAIAMLDAGLQKAGFSPNLSLSSLVSGGHVKESIIHWPDLRLEPTGRPGKTAALLPTDSSGSHYFAARATDSAYVQTASFSPTNSGIDSEKFLFYRGVGNFVAPLTVTMASAGSVSVVNTGLGTLSHLFVLSITGGGGKFVHMTGLKPGEHRDCWLDSNQIEPLELLRQHIRDSMARALTAQGLYPREALAMVNTWDDSWFTEQGTRVLYILPRPWTDAIIPMTIDPKPKELVRVMVGRAELIGLETENRLERALTEASRDPAAAAKELDSTLQKLGRFAGPVLDQALSKAHLKAADQQRLLALLDEERKNDPRPF